MCPSALPLCHDPSRTADTQRCAHQGATVSSAPAIDAAVQGGTMRPTVSMVMMMAVILGALLSMHAGAQGRGQQVQLPDGPGREMVQGTCTQCHGLNLITGSFGYTQEGWEDRIHTMLTLPQEQLHSITAYLAMHFPPRPSPAAVMISG